MNLATESDIRNFAAHWWAWIVRGVAAVLFGILVLAVPKTGLLALIILWGTYAILGGVVSLVLAFRASQAGYHWGWLVLEGIVGIGAGVVAFLWPGITALVLLALIALWAIVTGIAEIVVALRVRKEIRGEWLLAIAGLLSVAFGVMVLVFPKPGLLAITMLAGAYAIVFGATLIGLGFELKSWRRSSTRIPREERAPTPV